MRNQIKKLKPNLPVNITVSKSPKIVGFVDRLNHPEGTNATFTCSIGSGDLNGLTFEWSKDGQKIVPTSKLRISVASENFNSILRVIDLKSNDSGTYSCSAQNQYGQDRINTRLFVKGKCRKPSSYKCYRQF